jgi:hypothetical protein
MVGLGRVELPTSPLSGARSSRLSYRPSRNIFGVGRKRGLEFSKKPDFQRPGLPKGRPASQNRIAVRAGIKRPGL